MEASILITVKNDRDNMIRLLSSLRRQPLDDIEVVIVDAFSEDGTYEVIKEFSNKMNLKFDRLRGNRAKGRNRCLEISKGENLIFLDSDTEVPDGWIEGMRKFFRNPIVAGKIIQRSDVKWSNLGRIPIIFKNEDVTYPSNNLKYSRKVIDEIGYFDERMHTAEDIDLNIRAVNRGYSIFYAEEVYVYHYPRENLRSLIKQSYYDGIGRKYIYKKYGLKSKFNISNLRNHFFIESIRLGSGMFGYLFGDFND